jgi:heterotetrameric sarcosine oxidase gamma subunit
VSDTSRVEFRPGRAGRKSGAPGIVVRELTDFALASVLARKGHAVAATNAAERAFGAPLPDGPRAVHGRGITFIGSGPGQYVALAESTSEGIEARIGEPLQGLVSVFDQSDSRVLLELSGDKVREVLAKGIAIDLHPRAFKAGDAAVTTASHLAAVHLWQTTDQPTYRVLVVRTYFESFWHWLSASAAEYGADVLEPNRYSADS